MQTTTRMIAGTTMTEPMTGPITHTVDVRLSGGIWLLGIWLLGDVWLTGEDKSNKINELQRLQL